ncbi:copper resistance CopC family protein [Agromyces atrinae]|uniref:CopC domain-containing protein n=1 Tax=Agromyces atrinae TaxID=592376 RepID=A0A852SEV2_9MICO|nr:copper resistance CopC family protein [Agromyces atrinae]NYD67784.1 hypothetical protein [Agromyces atrinae]
MTKRILRRSGGALAVSLLLAAALSVGVATPAFAHDQLLDSSPAVDENLDAAPADVALTFSDDVLTIGALVLVVDDAGNDWVSGETRLDGDVVTAPLATGAPDGVYEVRWRVVSADGHPISGVIPFSIGDVAPAPVATAEPSPAAADEAAPDESASDDSFAVLRPVLLGLGGAALALGVWWALARVIRRRPRS